MDNRADRLRQQAWINRTGQNETGMAVYRPVVLLAGAWSLGKILISWPTGRWLAFPIVLVVFVLTNWFCGDAHTWLKLALPIALTASLVQGVMILIPAERQALELDGRYFLVQGRICNVKAYPGGSCQARLRQKSGILLQVTSPIVLDEGSHLEVGILGSRPFGQRNPGGFDEARWLATQGIFLKGKIIDEASIRMIEDPPAFSLVTWGKNVRDACYRLACRLLSADQAALLNGLLLGDTSQLDPETKMDFHQAGLSHLMSVSGANVAYILLPLASVLKRSRLNRILRMVAVLPVLLSFGFITGWQVSVSRAILMSFVTVLGRLFDRRVDTANALGLAVLILQLIWPLSPLSVGFWLSVTASAALIYGAEKVGRSLARRSEQVLPFRIPHGVTSAIAATICAQTAVMPLIVHTGGTLSLAGVLANLPAGPLAGGTTLLASALIPIALILDRFSGDWTEWVFPWLGRSLSFALDLLAKLASMAARVPLGRVFTSQVNLVFQLFLLLIVFLVFRPIRLMAFLRQSRLRILTSPGLLMAVAVVLLVTGWGWNRLIHQYRSPVEVWFFDVGQGDAILIREQGGQTILIDGGKPGSGYQVLLPALDELAIDKIDLAIATHGHDDHAGGLIELAGRGRIKQLMISAGEAGMFNANTQSAIDPNTLDAVHRQAAITTSSSSVRGEENVLSELVSICRDHGIDVQSGAAHDTIMLGQAVRLRILHPFPDVQNEPDNEPLQASPDANAQALQILAELCSQRFLLTSDCTAKVEHDLLERGEWPQADLLKVAHHGSRKTTETAFLDQVRPQDAVISVGTNYYGHPAADTLDRLQMAGCDILRTDQSGAVFCQVSPEGYTIATWLEPAA